MFNKSFLLSQLVKSLARKEFQLFLTSGCFDIAAKREYVMLIKALTNIDGLLEEQARSLRAISYFVSAFPFVVSERSNRGKLSDEIIYSRFELPVVTLRMFNRIIEEEVVPEIKSSKGKHTVTINTVYLRERRKELKLSLEKLSKKVGISKKALYEIENQRVNPSLETVRRLERVLGIDLKVPYRFKHAEATYLEPKNEFQRRVSSEFSRIGIDNSSVYSAPFKIVGREEYSLITSLSSNTTKIRKEAARVKRLSSILSSQGMFVVKKSKERSIEGIPVILEAELPELESPKELSELIKEKGGIDSNA